MFMLKRCFLSFGIFILCLFMRAGTVCAADCGLRVITEETYPSTIVEDGRLTGFGVDIVRAMMKEIGCETTIELMPWARGYKHLLSHPDILLFATARTEEREDKFNWIGPLACYKWVFYGLKDMKNKVKSLEDAKKVFGIGVYRNDARAQFLKSKGFTNLEVMDSQEVNFKKLLRQRVKLVATSNIGVPGYLAANEELRKKAIPIFSFNKVRLYLALSKKTDPETLQVWQDAFDTLSANGIIRKIQNKWIQECND